MNRTLISILFLWILVACNPSESLTDTEKTDIITDVRNTLNNYYNDIRKYGLTAEFKYLDNSPEFFWVPPGYSTSISYDSVAAVLNKNAPNFTLIDNSFDTLQIVPLSKEIATYTGRLHSRMTDTSGRVTTISLIETGVLIKRQEGWKLLNGQTSMLNQ